MSVEQYVAMCEQMGWEPKEEEIPIEFGSLPEECQQAVTIFNLLPDLVEGMSGSWLGKDYSCLEIFMNIYEVENRQEVLNYILVNHREYHEYYQRKQKMREQTRSARAR